MNIFWHFCVCELRSTHVGEKKKETCWKIKNHVDLVRWMSRQQPLATDRQLHDAFPLKCPECVQHSLSDWTHAFHRDESVPFLLVTSASSCPVKVTSDAIDRGDWLSPLCTHSRLSCDHICGGLCGQARKWVYDKLKVSGVCVWDHLHLLVTVCQHGRVGWKAWQRPTDQWSGINVQGQSVNGSLLGHFAFMVSLFRCQEEYFLLSPTLTDKH